MTLAVARYIACSAMSTISVQSAVTASNIANADTPHFKARDLDFREALAAASSPGATGRPVALVTTQPGHLGGAPSADPSDAALKYRVPLAPSLDGNTVDAQLEQAAFAENAVRYQATLTFLSSRFRSLMTAITGQ